MYGGPPPSGPTPWIQPADRYAGRCETRNGANVLLVRPVGNSHELNASPTPDWGLHLADANLTMVQLLDVVRQQIAAYVAQPKSCTRTIRARRIKGLKFKRVEVYAGTKLVARKNVRTIKLTVTKTTKVRLRVTYTHRGHTIRVTERRTIRAC
jgi:hypothetical protein